MHKNSHFYQVKLIIRRLCAAFKRFTSVNQNSPFMKELDVRIIEASQTQQTIIQEISNLGHNESLMIINNYDPKPLKHRLNDLYGDIYDWKYSEEGPETWRVIVSKNQKRLGSKTVGEWVKEDYQRSEIFKKYGIDFCCHGDTSLQKACANQNINMESVIHELNNSGHSLQHSLERYSDWDVDFLTEYIVQNHHKYIRKITPEISKYFNKVTQVHSANHPELKKMSSFFKVFSNELLAHLKKEEQFLFPFIKALAKNQKNNVDKSRTLFDTVKNPILRMLEEHDHAGNDIETLEDLSNHYTLPDDACASYRYLFNLLQEFEEDLHKHIHLENNILFPEAIKLEQNKLAEIR